MSTNIRFMVYNAFGIGGTVKTIFNFADFFQKTGNYNVEIISIKKTRDTPMLSLNSKVKITVIQDARRGIKYSDEEKILLGQPSELINKEEDLYMMFNAYTDKRMIEVLGNIHNGILVTTMPSFNMLSATLVDKDVLKIGQEHKSFADHTPGLQQLIRESYGQLDALTILTEKNKHIYERKIKGSVPIFVLGNGTERQPFRANLKNHIIVAAGRYAYQKGYDMLIKAFSLIAKEYPDWILKIYGEGSLAKEYNLLIHKYGLENRIILEPGSDKMNEKLSEASIHVCSSYYEPFGMVIIEGFAMGIPCVSFACDGPSEIITDGYDGILVPKEDIEALANAMERLMTNEQFRLELGKNAYESSKKYDINSVGKNFQDLVGQVQKLKFQKQNKEADLKKDKDTEILKIDQSDVSQHDKIGKDSEVIQEQRSIQITEQINYDELTAIASAGNIGLKTLLKMLKGWFVYKICKNREH